MSERPLKIFSGSSHPALAAGIAKELGTELDPVMLGQFSDGSNKVRLPDSVRGSDAYVVQTCRPGKETLNTDLMELWIMIHTLRRNKADRIHAVIPHLGYARDDSESSPDSDEYRKSVAAQLMAILTEAAGADSISAVHLHSRQESAFFRKPVDNIYATRLLVDYLNKKRLKDPIVVAPDTGAAKTIRYVSNLTIGTAGEIIVINKHRPADNVSEVTDVIGDIAGRTCIVWDDMFDTFGTIENAVRALRERGANKEIYAVATHPLLTGSAIEKIKRAELEEIIFTDTVPLSPEKKLSNMMILSVAPLLADNIRRSHY